ncbi:hypothetical protein BGZ99_003369 [Dissophora globulifera]|uniref:Uncharacterized protein n=1 Tax=Dissophora globulifera TaxID=979702 RepID=A0A9P6UWI1_9FUNG|nr:hypothetical protein BGZ99_003369 [Dissophora globulifera]
MVAPVKNLLAKSMLNHIGFSLALGTVAAYASWHSITLPAREVRKEFYIKYNANKA